MKRALGANGGAIGLGWVFSWEDTGHTLVLVTAQLSQIPTLAPEYVCWGMPKAF